VQRTIYTSEHETFRDMVRTYADRVLSPAQADSISNRAISKDTWLKAGEQGLLGLDIPEELGGNATSDYRYNVVLTEELAKVSAAVASAFTMHFDIVTPYLLDLGTEEQKRRWLPRAASGHTILALAMTEPSGGSDLAALRTTATKVDGGWLLNGSKTFITNGFGAGLTVVAARTSLDKKARGITLFAVEDETPGFTRGKKLDKVGQPEADTAELFFNDAFIADADVIGEIDRGFIHMMQRLPRERLSTAVANLAHAAQIVDETIQYARERKAFGSPIGSFQHNKFVIAEMVTKIDVTQAYLDHCVTAYGAGSLTNTDAAKAKWWAADIQNEVLDACVQIYGGYGYMREYRVARAWMDARVTKIWAGSNEIMKELIGRDLGL
jgi:alkylation response protein AidB-like acyl-CoA dehydrogenase